MSRTLVKLGTVRTDDGTPLVRLKLVARYYAGRETPLVTIYRNGRNGSPAGAGPVGPYRTVTLPHLKWATAYKYKRFGGLRAYRLSRWAYARLIGSYT